MNEQRVGTNASARKGDIATIDPIDAAGGLTFAPGSMSFVGPEKIHGKNGRYHNLSKSPYANQVQLSCDIFASDNTTAGCKVTITATVAKGGVPDE